MNKILKKLYNSTSDIINDSDDVIRILYEDLNKIENPTNITKLKTKALSLYLDAIRLENNVNIANNKLNKIKND